ncbi:MAG: hypothetical protein KDE27_15705 [Planctomycetes bacterium]|nr:hypothetical protein [Planctomycetota bacterium]
MQFLPAPNPDRRPAARERWPWGPLLFVSAATAVLATRWPWITVAFQRLWGNHDGPPGWESTAGFTCLCTSALVAIMALAETRTPSSQQAVRPGSLMLAALATAMLAFELSTGPGTLRGVSARWTGPFWVACAALPVLLLCCAMRFRALKQQPPAAGWLEPDRAHSGSPPDASAS